MYAYPYYSWEHIDMFVIVPISIFFYLYFFVVVLACSLAYASSLPFIKRIHYLKLVQFIYSKCRIPFIT